MKKVLITGGTGLIGKRLSFLLESKGYEVRLLSRKENRNSEYPTYTWDITNNLIDKKAFKNLDFIIHLAGAGITDKKWSKKRKQVIINSRVDSTKLLFETIKNLQTPIKAFISSSAIGYYGCVTNKTIYEEEARATKDFLGKVCSLWEKETEQFQNEKIRTIIIRTGIVLSKNEGVLSKMKSPIITPLGNGKQYMPWIHIDDLCEIYIRAIEDQSMKGIYNGVAPEHQTNKSFSKILAKTNRKSFLPIGIPSFLLKLLFGKMSIIFLNGSRISSKKIESTGFCFLYPSLKTALENLNK